MKIINEMKIDFLSKSSNESFGRVAVSAFVSQLDPTVAELSDIKTAVSEAVTNCIVHGYEHTYGIISVIVRIFESRVVEISVIDRGKGIENVEKAMEPMFTTGNAEERSGMGFTVMETFMDKIKVISKPADGTKVIMIKKLCADT
ncbi:MAG: anti-sigma F factor [Clostridia bacterium]|nr:anti-sigma F factor [Clostridia bacterium]